MPTTPEPPHNTLMPQRQTLVGSAVHALLANIESGRWIEVLPGERTLCEDLEISRPTLRLALKVLEQEGRLEVSQGKKRRILGGRIAEIPVSQLNVIGLLSPFALQSLPPFVLFWIDEVRGSLAKAGYRLEFHHSLASKAQNPNRALEQLVHSAPVALWILLLSSPAVQRWFMEHQRPCIAAGSCAPDIAIPSVDIDYRAACRHAAGVLRHRGHERLALVMPASGLMGDSDSETGFCEAIASAQPPLILRHDGTREGILRHLESSQWLKTPPTGFLVARSAHALTVLTFLVRHGAEFPSKFSVISRDDDEFLNFATPDIARYKTDPALFARQISRAVLKMVRSGSAPAQPVRLMPVFYPGYTA